MRLSRDIIDRALDWDVSEANVLRRWYVTSADRTPDYVLAHIADGMDRLTRWYEGTVVIDVFPRPDAYFTNEHLRIRGDRRRWSATLCGRPDRQFGEVPERLQDILIDHGWRADAVVDRKFQRVACRECGFVHPCDWVYEQPAHSSTYDVVAHVADAARLIHDAPAGEWFVQASVYNSLDEVGEITQRCDLHPSHDDLAIDCVVDLVELLPLDARFPLVRRALWPNDSVWAEWACFLEVHDAHEGPCPLEEYPDDEQFDEGFDDDFGDPNAW